MDRVRQLMGIVLQAEDTIVRLVGEAVARGIGLEGIEEGIARVGQKVAMELTQLALEELDRKLMAGRGRGLEVAGRRTRSLLTSFGELKVSRRVYRGDGGEGGRFLLDEALKLGARARVSRRLLGLAVELACGMSMRRAARVLGQMVPGLSVMGVWRAVREAGEACRQGMAERRRRVYEGGELTAGTRRVEELKVEADAVAVRLQRSPEKWGEVKLVVAYEGRERVGGERSERYALKSRCVAAAVATGEVIWEEAGVQFGERWALDQVGRVWVGGDGARWVKAGLKWFPRSAFVLDRFHLKRRLLQALGQDPGLYQRVCAIMAQGSLEQTLQALDAAARVRQGRARREIEGLMVYLAENWEGIANLPTRGVTGAIEGQVCHRIARRMKRNGARWSPDGADRMARLLAAEANGELDRYLHRPSPAHQEAPQAARRPAAAASDPEGPWRIRMPVLYGPHASRPYARVIRHLSHIQPVVPYNQGMAPTET
ncbi:MAG: ISLre2 family transposase [Acetobacteraceae bacterium]|nr:ISLre2 family transposase [Acetobacteraceae bacterium]